MVSRNFAIGESGPYVFSVSVLRGLRGVYAVVFLRLLCLGAFIAKGRVEASVMRVEKKGQINMDYTRAGRRLFLHKV